MLQFGFFLTPTAADYPNLLRQAQLAESMGLDLIGIQDHPYQHRFLDTWTLISVLAAQTEKVRFFPDVANLPLRPPTVLAKSAASLDVITGGRVELGLGAGGFWQAVAAMGGPERQPKDAVNALEEAVQIVRLIWSGQRGVRFQGKHYQLRGAHTGPVPAHEMEIWIGGNKSRMLSLIGRHADGWIPSSPYVPRDQLLEKNERIDEAAVKAGRDPAKIRRIYNVMGEITSEDRIGYLEGPVEYWIEELIRLVEDYRMDSFIFGPKGWSEEQMRLFAEEVVPQVRANQSG